MDSILTTEQQVKDLRTKGLSFRKIAEKLNLSLGKVQRIMTVSGVSIHTENVSENVSKCIDTVEKPQNTGKEIENILELKIKINSVLKTYNDRLNTLNKSVADLEIKLKLLKEELSNEFNMRVNKVIGYSLKSHIEKLREDLIKHVQEIKRE